MTNWEEAKIQTDATMALAKRWLEQNPGGTVIFSNHQKKTLEEAKAQQKKNFAPQLGITVRKKGDKTQTVMDKDRVLKVVFEDTDTP